jgi:quercetin dioxygenase-like cupin family protein
MDKIPLRRVVTGHDAAGRAVVTDDALLTPNPGPVGVADFTLVWTTTSMPVDNDDATDGRQREVGLSMPGGTVLRIVDMLPGGVSSMHRTSTIDYGIVMSGVVELELDDGAVTRMEAGAVIVQRGTLHAWRNPSADTTARIAFVLIDAKPATVNGESLPSILPGRPQPKS